MANARGNYDVFLSHAGEQKLAFVDCLYTLLKNQLPDDISVFMDEHSLEPADPSPWETIVHAARHTRVGKALHTCVSLAVQRTSGAWASDLTQPYHPCVYRLPCCSQRPGSQPCHLHWLFCAVHSA
jgi:hypothetical protein